MLRDEPALFQAETESHAGAVQDDMAVAGRQVQLPAEVWRFKTEELAHHEHAGGIFGQPGQTGFEHDPELLLREGCFRVTPSLWAVFRVPMTLAVEQHCEIIAIRLIVRGKAGDRGCPLALAQTVHDLVF